jgi:hypothetical protein
MQHGHFQTVAKSAEGMPMSLAFYPTPNAGLVDFIELWAVIYGGLIAVYFIFCGLFHWMNALYPERRIQSRPMKKQIALEIGTSVTALASIAAYVAGGLFMQAKGWALTPLALTVVGTALIPRIVDPL